MIFCTAIWRLCTTLNSRGRSGGVTHFLGNSPDFRGKSRPPPPEVAIFWGQADDGAGQLGGRGQLARGLQSESPDLGTGLLCSRLCENLKRGPEKSTSHLSEHLRDAHDAGGWVGVDSTGNVLAEEVMNSQHGVAPKTFAEAFGGCQVAQGVDEDRHEALRHFDYLGVAQRTAGERLATGSAGIFAKVEPEGDSALPGLEHGRVIISVPADTTNLDGVLGAGWKGRDQNQGEYPKAHGEVLPFIARDSSDGQVVVEFGIQRW